MAMRLGDSGYPAEPWLLTPLATPTTPSETAYNAAHVRTRNVIERCFGVMKSRFRCLDQSGGTLLYTPERACRIVTAVCVLHNFCITRNIATTLDAGVLERSAALQPATPPAACQQNRAGAEFRRRVIQQYF
jgi:DDE superfamily endonuclease